MEEPRSLGGVHIRNRGGLTVLEAVVWWPAEGVLEYAQGGAPGVGVDLLTVAEMCRQDLQRLRDEVGERVFARLVTGWTAWTPPETAACAPGFLQFVW
ncbi:MAG TPA: hypothetical protein VHD91_01180 [Gaiellaceae bacterium]|nr:hypothetical protein [Gaiellaceae bacterium]